MTNFLDSRLPESFWSKVSPCPMTGCWLWAAASTPDGYGTSYFYGGNRTARAHRVAYKELVGPIPAGLQLDHLCRVRCCVNPDHLEPVTNEVNCKRGQSFAAINAKKTHCVNGHELIGKSLYIRKDGGRKCYVCAQACSRAAKTKRRAERRAARAKGAL